MTLAQALRGFRENVKLTQGDVAKEFGYSTSQFVSNWERGLSRPPKIIVTRLAKLYNIPSRKLSSIYVRDVIRDLGRKMK